MQNDKANIEAKAKFFALYLGQQVLVYKQCETPKVLCSYDLCPQNPDINDTDYLLLRSVKQLNEDELVNISIIYNPDLPFCHYQKVEFAREILKDIQKDNSPNSLRYSRVYMIGGYLRSIGILIPFTTLTSGEVKTYSEEEIIQNGWCKLAEN